MSTLQWALLLLGVGIAVALIWSSRREKKAQERMNAPAPSPASRDWGPDREPPAVRESVAPGAAAATRAPLPQPPEPPRAGDGPRPQPAQARFDELGVGRPRPAARPATQPPRMAPEVGAPPGAAAALAAPEKLVGLYIAEHEGTNILGPKIHAALKERGLRYGDKRIYHRYEGDTPLFSVASLVKPGALDPGEAEGFATPGLSVFMVLPGPARPVAAFQEMLDTARGLARALNAELYDSEQRAPLTLERERALHEQVEDWARRHAGAARPTA